jgi:hypothetical protein
MQEVPFRGFRGKLEVEIGHLRFIVLSAGFLFRSCIKTPGKPLGKHYLLKISLSLFSKCRSTGNKDGKILYKCGSTFNKDANIFNKCGSTGNKEADIFSKCGAIDYKGSRYLIFPLLARSRRFGFANRDLLQKGIDFFVFSKQDTGHRPAPAGDYYLVIWYRFPVEL